MKTVSAWQDFVKEPEKRDNILMVAEKSKRDLLNYLQSAPVYDLNQDFGQECFQMLYNSVLILLP